MDVFGEGRWWTYEPELCHAFQVERIVDDSVRCLWWGNQVVGRAVRVDGGRWQCLGRDDVHLCDEAADDGLYASADQALLRARDAWRYRPSWTSPIFGGSYWVEPRRGDVASLWLGRMYLGRSEPDDAGGYLAFNDDMVPLPHDGRPHPSHLSGLLAMLVDCDQHFHRLRRNPAPAPLWLPQAPVWGESADQPRPEAL